MAGGKVIADEHEQRARILGAVARERSATRRQRRRQDAGRFAVGGGVALAIFLASGGVRPEARPPSLLAATAVGSALLPLAAPAPALRPGASMLGWPPPGPPAGL